MFNKGDRVKLNTLGLRRYSHQSEGTAGVVDREKADDSYLRVTWDNGHTNAYYEEELEYEVEPVIRMRKPIKL